MVGCDEYEKKPFIRECEWKSKPSQVQALKTVKGCWLDEPPAKKSWRKV